MLFAVDGIDHGQAVRAETGERVGKHGTQFTDTLRDLRLTGLQVGDALLHTFKLVLGCLTTLVDLLVGLFGGLLENAGSLLVGCLTLVGSVCLGLIARMLRFGNQLFGLLLGGFTAFVQVGEQLVDLLRSLILLGGNVGADLLHLGIDLADGLGAMHFGLVGDLLCLGFGGIRDFRGTALRVRHHLGHLLTHVGQLLVGFGQRGFDLVVGLAFHAVNLVIGVLALRRDLLGGFGTHIGELTLLRGALRCETLVVLLTGVCQFQINGLALRHHGLLRFATQLVSFALGVGLQHAGIIIGLRQHRFSLGVSLVENTLGVELGVVQQGFGLKLHRGACRGSVFLGTVK